HQPTSQQSSHRNHGHNNDRHRSDRRSGGIPVMGVTRETRVSSPTDMPIQVLSSPGVPLRATPIHFALLVDADTQESVVELLFDDKIRIINALPLDMCEFDIILDELPGIPPVREFEFNIELSQGQNPSPRLLTAWLR
nr:hypothetical protein [Tanacetum cinerariifolium]